MALDVSHPRLIPFVGGDKPEDEDYAKKLSDEVYKKRYNCIEVVNDIRVWMT